MSTFLQKELAKNIIENSMRKGKEKMKQKELLIKSGYNELTAEKDGKHIIERKGTQEHLVKLGFSEDNAKRVVAEILESTKTYPRDRLTAADMMFKVHGSYAPTKSLNMNIDVNELQKTIVEQIESFRNSSIKPNDDT